MCADHTAAEDASDFWRCKSFKSNYTSVLTLKCPFLQTATQSNKVLDLVRADRGGRKTDQKLVKANN